MRKLLYIIINDDVMEIYVYDFVGFYRIVIGLG